MGTPCGGARPYDGRMPVTPERPVRAFVALPLPDAARGQLGPFLAACEQRAPRYRWVPVENLHLTLRFLGGLDPERLARVRKALAGVEVPPFDVRLGELGTFGGRSRPRVVWLGLAQGAGEVGELAAAVSEASVVAGLEPETAPFRAHLTLARSGDGAGRLPELPPPPAVRGWRADAFSLYQSRLGRPRAVYVPITTYELR